MTFQQELRIFFKKHDPDRIILARSIASKFKTDAERKVVLNRLKIVYDNGGPANIVLGDPNNVSMEEFEERENQVEETMETSNVEVEIDIDIIEIDINIESDSQDIEIDIPDGESSSEESEEEKDA